MSDIPQRVATTEEVVLIKVMGGAAGPPGPAGKDGESVEVYGPQAVAPIPHRKGDIWLCTAVSTRAAVVRPAHVHSHEITYLPGAGPDAR